MATVRLASCCCESQACITASTQRRNIPVTSVRAPDGISGWSRRSTTEGTVESGCQSGGMLTNRAVCHQDEDSLILPSPPSLKTSLTFLSLPVLFLFAHAAGMVCLRVVVF